SHIVVFLLFFLVQFLPTATQFLVQIGTLLVLPLFLIHQHLPVLLHEPEVRILRLLNMFLLVFLFPLPLPPCSTGSGGGRGGGWRHSSDSSVQLDGGEWSEGRVDRHRSHSSSHHSHSTSRQRRQCSYCTHSTARVHDGASTHGVDGGEGCTEGIREGCIRHHCLCCCSLLTLLPIGECSKMVEGRGREGGEGQRRKRRGGRRSVEGTRTI
ncbi:hypothetical protein PMAYCL1PPCAC_23325, partial [Pristionchus mayeri]